MQAVARKLSVLVLPLITILLSWWLLLRVPYWLPVHQELLILAPYLLALVALVSAYHFRRGRVCLLVVLLGYGYYLMQQHQPNELDTPRAWLVYQALAVLLPLNLLLISLMREKGLSGLSGRMRLAFLGGQLLLVWFTLQQGNQTFWNILNRPVLRVSVLEALPLPQISLLLLVLTAIVLLHRTWQSPAPIDGALFGVSIASFVLLAWPAVPYVAVLFSAAAVLMLILAVIQDSHDMAFRDDLTGLPSRRALNELLRGLGGRFTIAMIDVDHFKRFNDTYGHDVGDQALKMVAGRLAGVSGGGRPFRYGGEEFTVVFPGKSTKEAAPHLERLRQNIAAYTMALRSEDRPKDDGTGSEARRHRQGSREVSVTVSIGAAESGGRHAAPEEVVRAADSALYRAKSSGRNQVCVAKHS